MISRHVVSYARAKLNLYLDILGRRPDGFHELETIFQTIDLADRITVAVAAGTGISLTCDDPTLPCDTTNLAWRAASAFQATHALPGRITIDIRKRIPAGAGLGGGSADAAAVLRACNNLAGFALPDAELERLGSDLGSDVAFLIRGGTAHATGRGEVLTSMPDLVYGDLTLLMPIGAHCATPAVYQALSEVERGPRPARGVAWFASRLPQELPNLLFNRLAAPACRVCPAVGNLLAYLTNRGVPHLMTGSGAACFALGRIAPPNGVRAWPIHLAPTHGPDPAPS